MARSVLALVLLFSAACGTTPTEPVAPRLGVTKILAFGDSLTEGDATPNSLTPFFIHPTNDPGPAKGYP
ncbi:MAG: hypothetical protein EPO35_11835, partial [Acidobacteria bacterium]